MIKLRAPLLVLELAVQSTADVVQFILLLLREHYLCRAHGLAASAPMLFIFVRQIAKNIDDDEHIFIHGRPG